METIINISPSELTEDLFENIKQVIAGKENIEITISIKDFDAEYANRLNQSMQEVDRGANLISFSMDDFLAYAPDRKI